jgi:hypothetical protein
MTRRNRPHSGTPTMTENTTVEPSVTDVVSDTTKVSDPIIETTISSADTSELIVDESVPTVQETPTELITGSVGALVGVVSAVAAMEQAPTTYTTVELPQVTTTRFDSAPTNSVEFSGWQSVIHDYLKTMAPGVPNVKSTVCIKQRQLFTMVLDIIRTPNPTNFGSGMRLLLAAFAENATKHFAFTHILRGLDNIELSPVELQLIQLLFPALRTYALGKGNPQAYGTISFDAVFGLENQFSEPEKQRLDAFLRMWCGVN